MSVFSSLKKELRAYLPKEHIEKIRQAYLFSLKAHHSQLRLSGKPYITHPVAVAMILAQMHMDSPSITAAILHDVLEDTETTELDVSKFTAITGFDQPIIGTGKI